MNLPDCYRLLGLTTEAKLDEIKASYRQLARQYHPDVNPGNQSAQAKFIKINQAYELLLTVAKSSQAPEVKPHNSSSSDRQTRVATVKRKVTTANIPELSALEKKLKWDSYRHLQNLLQQRNFVSAIAIVEGLVHRLPQDPEVRQWQAISYQQRGRELIAARELDKARIYLKKALKCDPHNRELWSEVERDFRHIERAWNLPL